MPGAIGASKGRRNLVLVLLLQLTVSSIVYHYHMDVGIETPFMKPEQLIFQLDQGDLVEFDRGIHQHWAMYYKDGKVFNIRKITPFTANITLEKLVDVAYLDPDHPLARKGNLTIYAKEKGLTARPAHESVAHALTMVKTIVPYNLVWKNCEYYATLWKFGKGFTTQPKKHATMTTGLLMSLMGVLVAPSFALGGYIIATVYLLSRIF